MTLQKRMYEDDFEGRLGRIVLEAFAYDVDVTGRRLLAHDDHLIPDVEVVITVVGAGPTGATEASGKDGPSAGSERIAAWEPAEWIAAEADDPTDRRAAFEAGLSNLLLAAYAEPVLADPAGTWRLSFPSTSIPDWSVEVAFHTADEDGGGREIESRSTLDGPSGSSDR